MPGIGPDELEAIQRDEFVYYTTVAYMQTDAADWLALRRALLGALVAALGLWRPPTQPDPSSTWRANARAQEQALELLDRVRDRYDPAVNWAGFLLELWPEFDTRSAKAQVSGGSLSVFATTSSTDGGWAAA